MGQTVQGMGAVILSVHDVTPAFSEQIKNLKAMLTSLDLPKIFLVTPLYRGLQENNLTRNAEFVDCLKAEPSEIILHGLTHVGTFMENEFASIDPIEAKRRIKIGMDILKNVGLETQGFVAPMWNINQNVMKILKKERFSFTETFFSIVDLERDRKIRSLVCNYNFGNSVINRLVLIPNSANFLLKKASRRLIRIALHPQDSDATLKHIKRLLLELKKKGFDFLQYREVLRLRTMM